MAALARWDQRDWVSLGGVALAAVLMLPPMALVLVVAFTTPDVGANPGSVSALACSMQLSGLAAVIALALGLIGALSVEAAPSRLRPALLLGLCVPFFIPSYVQALAWSALVRGVVVIAPGTMSSTANAGSPVLAAWVLAVSYGPIATLILWSAHRRWSPGQSDSARTHGCHPLALLHLRLRYLAWPAATAGLIVFLLAFADFAVPDFFLVPTYTSEIFAQVSGYLDPAAAAAMTLPVMIATALMMALLVFSARRIERSLGRNAPSPDRRWDRSIVLSLTGGVFATTLAAILSGLPLYWMISKTGSFDELARAFRATHGDLVNSLVLSVGVALIAVAVAQVPAYVMARSRQTIAASIRLIFAISLAVPASLLGLALIALGNRPGLPGLAYDAGIVLVVAMTVKWLPVLAEILRRAWQTAGRDQEEAALANGVSWWKAILRIGAVSIAPATIAGGLLMFVLAFNELTLVSLLAPPGLSTLPLRIFQTVHYGPESLLAAICLIQVFAVGVSALAALALASRGALHAGRRR